MGSSDVEEPLLLPVGEGGRRPDEGPPRSHAAAANTRTPHPRFADPLPAGEGASHSWKMLSIIGAFALMTFGALFLGSRWRVLR